MSSAAEGTAFATLVAPNIAAPLHQHFFSFRIDFDVDGTANRLVEENTHGSPAAGSNAFEIDRTPITVEGSAISVREPTATGSSSTRQSATRSDSRSATGRIRRRTRRRTRILPTRD